MYRIAVVLNRTNVLHY